MPELFSDNEWLPIIFAALMGFAMLVYAVLDGYDLGVGLLQPWAKDDEKDVMIASIGPFWDANETWLVLGVGLLLVAFPAAHGMILTNLYLPVAIMLIGLILRGVAFDFRVKGKPEYKRLWNKAFFGGSLLMAVSQGYMLGSYILGFEHGAGAFFFSLLAGIGVAAGYCLIGSCWLVMKTQDSLQRKAVVWARISLWATTLGIALVSMATPLASARIFDKWFSLPEFYYLAPIPAITGLCVVALDHVLRRQPSPEDKGCWHPFVLTVVIYVLCFVGLAYSFFPYIVPDKLLIGEAASAPESLTVILIGALLVLPMLIGYTFLAYKVFHGKASDLRYD